ncbi:MAG: GAF domain-containing protein [Syntrophales bacterium]|jgi:uncharacterized protein YigA (DUF484 family)|nr:GAF domain-containing protein [Syntrophales bacterium]MDD5231769.1 GAF domain-containing protein [Syntrophales bacterium]MDD5532396.1 GAF domain-containing protein [Syntrophales bacterium]HPL63865.1 GAF domain-containing protein [Syntrophales bacterium]
MDAGEMEKIFERLRVNQEIADKFFEIETCILSVLDFKALFEKLLSEIGTRFSIPYVWLSMVDESEISPLIGAIESSDDLRGRLKIIESEGFLELVEDRTKPLLANGDLKHFYKLFPSSQKYFLKSIAVVPLLLDGRIIGSLNLGDSDPMRYRPGMDTRFLEQLAVKLSICLSNVTAHEKLRLLAEYNPAPQE